MSRVVYVGVALLSWFGLFGFVCCACLIGLVGFVDFGWTVAGLVKLNGFDVAICLRRYCR